MWRRLINMWKRDNLLDEAWKQSFEMLDITHDMFIEAVRVLRESEDKKVKKFIWEKDHIVNKYLQEVRRKVLTHCAVQGPEELPGSLVLASIVIDIERLGDYTKNIVELVSFRPETLSGYKYEKKLKDIESAVKDNFIRTKECVEQSDQEVALALLDEYSCT